VRIAVWHEALLLQISGDRCELRESGFQIFDDFGGDDVRIWEIGAVFERFIFQPEDVEVDEMSPTQFRDRCANATDIVAVPHIGSATVDPAGSVALTASPIQLARRALLPR